MARTATKKKVTKKGTAKTTNKKSRVTQKTTKQKLAPELEKLLERAEAQQREEAKGVKKTSAKTTKKRTRKVGTGTATVQATSTVREISTSERGRNFSPEMYERHYIPFKSLITEKDGQLTKADMRKLSITARLELWKNLNKDEETRFISLVTPEEARKERVSFIEAVARGLVEEKKPVKDALYCGYCQSWQKFKKFAYLDSKKCIGCGISSNDFYVKSDNGLWATKS